jgi:hypothetical protein
MSVYSGGPVSGLGGRLLPTYYFAIRDPSCIKVKSVDAAPRQDGVRYVSLLFERDRMVPAEEAAALLRHDGESDSAFIVTVSLPVAREEQFCRAVLPQSEEEWTDMFDRLCSMGPRRS